MPLSRQSYHTTQIIKQCQCRLSLTVRYSRTYISSRGKRLMTPIQITGTEFETINDNHPWMQPNPSFPSLHQYWHDLHASRSRLSHHDISTGRPCEWCHWNMSDISSPDMDTCIPVSTRRGPSYCERVWMMGTTPKSCQYQTYLIFDIQICISF